MKLRFGRGALVLSMAAIVSLVCLQDRGSARSAAATPQGGAQERSQSPSRSQDDGVRLPNGKLQRDEILKAEHQRNLKDAAQLVELSQQLQEELEKNDSSVLSLSTLKKTDDIEKLVKKIRSRMRHN
jgi:hypothetical protein